VGELREPRTRDPGAVVAHTLVLAVQGLVVAELFGDDPGNEAHFGPAPLNDPNRGCRTGDHLDISAPSAGSLKH